MIATVYFYAVYKKNISDYEGGKLQIGPTKIFYSDLVCERYSAVNTKLIVHFYNLFWNIQYKKY